MLHPFLPLSEDQQRVHQSCNDDEISRALSHSAYHLSKVEVFKVTKR